MEMSAGGFLMVAEKPRCREVRHLFECAGLFEQVGRPGNDRQFFVAVQRRECSKVEVKDGLVFAADDEQCRSSDSAEMGASEVGPPATGNDRKHRRRPFGRRDKRCRRSGAGAEKTWAQPRGF